MGLHSGLPGLFAFAGARITTVQILGRLQADQDTVQGIWVKKVVLPILLIVIIVIVIIVIIVIVIVIIVIVMLIVTRKNNSRFG